MSDQSEILKALEASNRAFEEFKKVNDERLAKMEKGEVGAASDLKVAMEKIFKDFDEQKKIVEAIEAKAKRPALGGDGKPVNEDVEAHRKAFDGYIRKGSDRELGTLEQKALGWSTNSGADGGYAVPKVIDDAIAALAVNISPIRSLARVQQVSTTDFHTLMNLRGTASGWVGETAARTATTSPTFADIKPTMGELYANLQATQQVLDDVFFNMESWISEQVATEFSRAEGAAFVSGNGTNQPTGFLTGTPVATADGSRAFGVLQYTPTGVAADWAASNKADVFFTTAATLKQAYRQGASWVMPKSILFDVMSFKDSGGRYVFNPQNAPGVEQNILGYPVVEAEDMPAKAANAFSVAFGNFQQGYIIVDRIGTRMIRDPFSNKPYIGFYVTKRVGGIVTNSEAIKLIKFAVS